MLRPYRNAERGKVPRPHHSFDRSMDRVQGLGQALFAILTAEPCASLPKVRFNACPAQASDRPAVNSKDLLKTVLTAKWDPATSISSACFSTESTNPRQMLSTTPVQRGKDLLVGVGLRLGRARQLPCCRRGSVFCGAVLELRRTVLHLDEAFGHEPTTSAQGGGTMTSETSTTGRCPQTWPLSMNSDNH